MDKLSNETVSERAETCRALITTITKRQMLFFGHVCRKEKLEYLVSTGKLEGKRARGQAKTKLCCKHEKENGTILVGE